jgi:hypothetical protein
MAPPHARTNASEETPLVHTLETSINVKYGTDDGLQSEEDGPKEVSQHHGKSQLC